ncbi:MAG: PLP-dependent aminotransferase family protein [Erysipelotrichaceae bacterium]|nr:PLP-dependent aminotransferase family protein [Erysipelotrichaceae bacterium]MDY6034321.1 PLP-dependent aminotransferase family protein [Bulleidia sp.]
MKNKLPAYVDLYYKLQKDITHGVYQTGAKLPSKRVLADKENVSVITVAHAYDLLVSEGYITSLQRSGYYVSYQAGDFFSTGEEDFIEDIPFMHDTDDTRMSYNIFAKTLRKVLNIHQESVLVKSPWNGLLYLRKALANYLARARGIYVDPEQIVIGSGAEYLYSLVVDIIGRDKTYAIEDPSYEQISHTYISQDVKLIRMKLGQNGILTSQLKEKHADVLHVTPYHSFPTGSTTDINKRKQYLKWAKDNHAWIVEDDYDSEYVFGINGRNTLFSLDEKQVIYLNTFSNTIASAVRIGYMILPKGNLKELQAKISQRSNTVSTLMQYLVAELIQSGSFERHINRVRKNMRKE